jgi:hypothetical protein
VQNTKRRGRPRNTEKSKRTKRKSRAKSLNYGVEEAQITEETLWGLFAIRKKEHVIITNTHSQ